VKTVALLLLLVFATTDSCTDQAAMDAKAKADQEASDRRHAADVVAKQVVCKPDHRFERTEVYPVSLRADIALDSCTDQLCKTWDWTSKSPTNADQAQSGV
jgi:hypothetical protein